MKIKSFLFLSLIFFFLSCDNADEVTGTGLIRYMELEGGFYGIIADNGEHYLPENLNSEFRIDSLRIAFEGIVTNKPTTQMWGHTIYLRHIKRIQ